MKKKNKIKINKKADNKNSAKDEAKIKDADKTQQVEAVEEANDAIEYEKKIAELTDSLQRVSADYQNYQKRSGRQIQQATEFASEDMARSLLPVLDNFDHAMDNGAKATDVKGLLDGFKIVQDQLLSILDAKGVKVIEVKPGCELDPSKHQALMHEESQDFDENTVVRELQKGYLMNDRTLRATTVSVAKAPDVQEAPAEDAPEAEATE